MTWTNVWFFIVPFLIAAALPGPAQGTLVAYVMTRGPSSALSFIAGMVSGNALWLVAAIFGLAALAVRFETAFIAIKWLGVAYLLFIAWKLWTSDATIGNISATESNGFLAGCLLTLGNPKAVIFFGAVLPHAFNLSSLTLSETIIIVALGLSIDLTVQLAYIVIAMKAKRLITSSRHLLAVNRGAAVLIGGCALIVAKRA